MNVFGRLVATPVHSLFTRCSDFRSTSRTPGSPSTFWRAAGRAEPWKVQPETATGTLYTFAKELKGHVLARHSTAAGCTGPETFDCQHGDLLYIFEERSGQPLKAIYFDNEGHVIHYGLSTPDATTAIFLSEPGPGPRISASSTIWITAVK